MIQKREDTEVFDYLLTQEKPTKNWLVKALTEELQRVVGGHQSSEMYLN